MNHELLDDGADSKELSVRVGGQQVSGDVVAVITADPDDASDTTGIVTFLC